MGLVAVFLLGIGLSLDTFAVSLSLGMACGSTTHRQKVRFLSVIGVFHFLMIMGGWLLGENASRLISAYDHWIAFVLLALVGGGMIREGVTARADEEPRFGNLLSLRNTLMLGVALSIDALIAGFSLGLVRVGLTDGSQLANILLAALIVGCCAFVVSAVGIFIGKKTSSHLGPKAEIFGGIILLGIGLKVLIEHLTENA